MAEETRLQRIRTALSNANLPAWCSWIDRAIEQEDQDLATVRADLEAATALSEEMRARVVAMSRDYADVVAELQRAREALESKHEAYRQLYGMWCRVARAMTPAGGPDITDEQVLERVESLSSTPPQNPPASGLNPPVFESNPPASETPQGPDTAPKCEVCGGEKGHP